MNAAQTETAEWGCSAKKKQKTPASWQFQTVSDTMRNDNLYARMHKCMAAKVQLSGTFQNAWATLLPFHEQTKHKAFI